MNGMIQQSQAEWVIMVYMAADDVLANFAIESLKQLRRAAGKDIVVAVQLDVDGPFARQRLRRFIFDGLRSEDSKIDENVVNTLDPATNMVDPRTLTEFIQWVYGDDRCRATHHCLILWGHGPELLAESAPAGREILKALVEDGSTRLYLTPPQLRRALDEAHQKFDIIGLDTCSSSIAEVAVELPGYADYMVASQEDVPDMSFPYQRLLDLFRAKVSDVKGICKTGVEKYITTYQDYVFGTSTDTSKVTLSSLNLENLKSITEAIAELADALLYAMHRPNLARLVFEARKKAHGFVAGLFVDLVDYCTKLAGQLKSPNHDEKLVSACQKVLSSLNAQGKSTCILANAALDALRCHGLSIYFPFLTDDERKQMEVTLVKGGTDILNKGGTDILNKIRPQRIAETEAYYPDLKLAQETHWYEFIRDGWSRILAEQLKPEELDVHYSAQQCITNLLSPAASKASKICPGLCNPQQEGKNWPGTSEPLVEGTSSASSQQSGHANGHG